MQVSAPVVECLPTPVVEQVATTRDNPHISSSGQVCIREKKKVSAKKSVPENEILTISVPMGDPFVLEQRGQSSQKVCVFVCVCLCVVCVCVCVYVVSVYLSLSLSVRACVHTYKRVYA